MLDIEKKIKMSYATEHIATTLRAARESKGLSQRALSKKAGVPQSHISKIETGAVDLRVSSLVALARALDLELMLVPRKSVSATRAIVRTTQGIPQKSQASGAALRELKRLHDSINSVAKLHPAVSELSQLQRLVKELQPFKQALSDVEPLRTASRALEAFNTDAQGLEALRRAVLPLQELRNALAHSMPELPDTDSVRPAYRLNEDNHG